MQAATGDKGASVQATPRIEYAIEGGPELGPDLHEIETSIRIDLATGMAFLEQHQPSSEQGGEPLGTFRAPLPPPLLTQLRTALAAVDLGALPPSTAGGPGSSLIRIKVVSKGSSREVQIPSRDIDALEKIDPLLSLLNDSVSATLEHPFQAIHLGVRYGGGTGSGGFTISIKNVGTERVALPDPQALGGAHPENPDGDLSLGVALFPEERPGVTAPPLQWNGVVLRPGATPANLVTLAPGEEVVRQPVAWTPAHRGQRHLAQAAFFFYGGPQVANGHLVVKGRALSEAIEITPTR
jgi:hypothetical protein